MKTFRQRITEFLSTAQNVASYTVRTVRSSWRSIWTRPTNDWGRSDYTFWRKAYFARARGLELSGLFIKPLCSKVAAWSIGRPPRFLCDSDRSQKALDLWWADHHAQILRAYRSALKQGDSFIVVNSDLTLTLLAPDCVDPIVDEADYSRILGWRVRQTLTHPQQPTLKMVMIDEYFPDRRIHRVEVQGQQTIEETFVNLLGRLPILHIANAPDDGETFGHAEAEALLETLHRYGAVFDAAIEGNILQGRPTPVLSFDNLQDLNAFWTRYGRAQTQTDPSTGRTETYQTLSVDLSQLLTVSAAKFTYEAPGNFAQDSERLLGLMFYLILEHTELPEFIFGNAIASSKASAETQMPVFEKFIEGRRGEIGGWIVELAEIALSYLSLIEPGVRAERPALQWQKLTQDGKLTLEAITWAFAEGLIDERTALLLAPIELEDIDAVLAQARKEREQRQQQEAEQMDQQLADEIEALEI